MRRVLVMLLVAAAALGALIAGSTDLDALPGSGRERLFAVSLLDGQTYFGHLEDLPWSESLVLRDVYYLQDARGATELAVALQQRGSEVHVPADGMRIRREKVLAVERLRSDSSVARAIAAERAIAARLR